MKKVFIAMAATVISAASVYAQSSDVSAKSDLASLKSEDRSIKEQKRKDRISIRKLEGNQVSYQAEQEFERDFKNVSDVSWSRTKFFDEVTFTMKGQLVKAFYGWDSNLVGTVYPKVFGDLPEAARDDINKHYASYNIDEVILFDDEESNDQDMVLFGNQFDDADNYFVELSKDNKTIVLQVTMNGEVGYFTRVK